jgi:hypothetical protein
MNGTRAQRALGPDMGCCAGRSTAPRKGSQPSDRSNHSSTAHITAHPSEGARENIRPGYFTQGRRLAPWPTGSPRLAAYPGATRSALAYPPTRSGRSLRPR